MKDIGKEWEGMESGNDRKIMERYKKKWSGIERKDRNGRDRKGMKWNGNEWKDMEQNGML